MDTVTFKLHPETIRAARELAGERDISVGQLIRDVLAREISKVRDARPSVRADERLVAPLRARLAGDLAYATGWDDLDTRLKEKGYVLRAAGGGLALHSWPENQRQCKASELGFSHARLMQRFGHPFPGHPNSAALIRRYPHMQTGAPEDAPEFDVIEPF